MTILHYEPWTSMSQLQDDMNKLFEKRLHPDSSTVESSQWIPLSELCVMETLFV